MFKPIHVKKGKGKVFMLGPDAWTALAASGDTNGQFDVFDATVSYMQGPPLHTHLDATDSFYVIDGVLTVQVGDEMIDLGPGEFASAPPGVPHTYCNRYKQPARIINIITPGGLDKMFEDMLKLPPGPPSPEAMAEICRKHRAEVVGPPIAARLGLK